MESTLARLRPMNIGDLFDAAFALYRDNFGLFVGIVAVVAVPQTLANVFTALNTPGRGAESRVFFQTVSLTLLGIIVTFVLSQMATAALARAIAATYHGDQLSVKGTYTAVGVGGFITVFLAVLLAGIITALGFVLLLFPGIYLAIRFSFVTQVVVIERAGVREALRRSGGLVKGSWWRVFGILLLVSILTVILTGIIGAVAAAIFVLGHNSALGTILVQVVTGLARILIQPISLGVAVLLYYDLRIRKEGYDLELAAQRMEATRSG